MNILFLGIIAIVAYIVQTWLGLKQIKNFNKVYARLRRKGKVAIGRRSGKLTSGTILMFSVNQMDLIDEAEMMQGTTILARFKSKEQFVGLNIRELDASHPVFKKENRLTRQAALNAKKIYLEVEKGNYQDTKPVSPVMNVGIHLSILKQSIQTKFSKGSV
ncbi:MAG: transcriptional regulator GutM [Enterococcus viikkiensis]